LPGETIAAEYVKEYGADIFEMQKGKMNDSDRVVVVDDLIATGTEPYMDKQLTVFRRICKGDW
jgi:hypothetical protein